MFALRPTLVVAGGLLLSPFALAQPLPAVDPFGPLPPTAPPGKIAPPMPARADSVKQAVETFQRAKDGEPARFAAARDLFAQASKEKALTADQTAAWAYCRVRCATDRLNASTDATTAADVVAEIEEALAAAPNHPALHTAAADILAAAKKRAGTAARPKGAAGAGDANAVDSASFVVKFQGRKATADELIRAAEKARADVFDRWSGPAGGDWSPKCEIVLHPTADAFAAATGLPATASGRAEVKLAEGKVASRRIDLRADDETLVETALPRELTHVILADLYPSKPPPAWAALAMAVLSTNPEEVDRYLNTARRCARDGELPSAETVLTAEAVPAKGVTGFHAESVAVAEYLVRWKGEKMFTAFVRDSLRYGPEAGLKRQYGLTDPRELDGLMRKK
jgi:hypothetical protein